jgi:hypothetical protein
LVQALTAHNLLPSIGLRSTRSGRFLLTIVRQSTWQIKHSTLLLIAWQALKRHRCSSRYPCGNMALLAALRGAVRFQAGHIAYCVTAGSLRPFAVSASDRVLLHGVHDLPAAPQGIIELREYQLQPASLKSYLQVPQAAVSMLPQFVAMLSYALGLVFGT